MTRRVLAVHTLIQGYSPFSDSQELDDWATITFKALPELSSYVPNPFCSSYTKIHPKNTVFDFLIWMYKKREGAMNNDFRRIEPLLWLIRIMGFSVPVSQKSPLRISALESQPLLFRSHYLKNTEVPPLPHPHMWQGRWAEGGEDGEGTGRTMDRRPPSSCLSSTLSAVLRAQSAKWTALSMSLWGTPET